MPLFNSCIFQHGHPLHSEHFISRLFLLAGSSDLTQDTQAHTTQGAQAPGLAACRTGYKKPKFSLLQTEAELENAGGVHNS